MADEPETTKDERRKPSLSLIAGGIAVLVVLVVATGVVLTSAGVFGSDDSTDTTAAGGNDLAFSADAAVVSKQFDDFWKQTFADQSRSYKSPKVAPFADALDSPCKKLAKNTVSFYCVTDKTIYLNDDFQAGLTASEGNVAQAFMMGHLYGHHVQEQLGIWRRVVDLELQDSSRASDLAHRIELQADCLAGFAIGGLTAREAPPDGTFTAAAELVAATALDRITPLKGALNPETWQNGPVTEEDEWFARGMTLTDVATCDTFTR